MKIRIVSNCSAGGHALAAGSIVDLPDSIAGQLVNMGRAKRLGIEIKTSSAPVETRDPVVVVDSGIGNLSKSRRPVRK